MGKPKLFIHVGRATHFLRWEIPSFGRFFDLEESPSKDAIVFAFGPDALATGATLPGKFRVAYLFPGFSYNPTYDLIHQYGMRKLVDDHFDLVFVNPGPMESVFEGCSKLRLCPFSIDASLFTKHRYRKRIESLLHASADSPQKDWSRSRDVMRLTTLKYEVYPPRPGKHPGNRIVRKVQNVVERTLKANRPRLPHGYVEHERVVAKYYQHDGFVHIAGPTPPYVDGKYTATLLEAGLSGCILFWHDTYGLGNDFETIFDLPLDPPAAAKAILEIRDSLDVLAHSRRTVEEIAERTSPDLSIRIRYHAIEELLR